MKLRTAILVLTTFTNSLASARNLFVEYGSCQYEGCPKEGQECCTFHDQIDQDALFCMTEEQKNGKLTGTYTDSDKTIWTWKCNIQEDITRE